MSFHQTLRVMQFSALLLLGCALQVAAIGVSQTITYSGKGARLEKIFEAVEQQTGYLVAYNTDQVRPTRPVTIQAEALPLEEFLQKILDGQALDFLIREKTIFIRQKKTAPKSADGETPPITVKGKVVNEAGEPVEGVTVMIKGTATGTVTNALGEFEIGEVPEKATLVFTSTAIEKLELKVSARTTLTVGIKRKISPLDEVQIIAYGETTNRFQTGNVSTVKGSTIGKQPVGNPIFALQGRVPGIVVEQSSGLPGAGITVRVQGQISLDNGSTPLYVIDGVPYSSYMLPTANSLLGSNGNIGPFPSGAGSPLSFINPSDIESIDILKDADATSIYGSLAAAGAILITTKKGKAGKTKIDFNIQTGWGIVPRRLKLLNTQQYLEMRKEAFVNDGLSVPDASTIPDASNYDLTVWDQNRYTDWQKILLGGKAEFSNLNASISGGTLNTQYLISGTYNKSGTVFSDNGNDQKGSFHLNLNNISNNQRFKAQIDIKYVLDLNRLTNTDLTAIALTLPPNAPKLYDANGELNWELTSDGNASWKNPLSYFESNKLKLRTNNLIGNAVLSYCLWKGVEIKSSFDYTDLQTHEFTIFNSMGYEPSQRPNAFRIAQFNESNRNSWQIQPQIVYKGTLFKGAIEGLFGTTFYENNDQVLGHSGWGYSSDLQMSSLRAAPLNNVLNDISQTYRYNALFARVKYSWADKYIVSLNARRDGSSRFGANNMFHNFVSAAGAWIFSNESYVQQSIPFVSFGKLRLSYGTTGNDQIGDYQFLSLYNSVGVEVPYQSTNGTFPERLANPYLQWEETRKLSAGLDVGFLKDKILINTTYFRNRSSNQLIGYTLPGITGFGTITRNFPALIQNSGIEFTLKTINYSTSKFTWSSNINLTLPYSKLLDFPNLASSSFYNSLSVGQPFIGVRKVLEYAGIDPLSGIYQFKKQDGTLTTNPDFSTDLSKTIYTTPKFYGGFQNVVSYKDFELDMLFQFVSQVGRNHSEGGRFWPGFFYSDGATVSMGNQLVSLTNRWNKSGDQTNIQKVSQNGSLFQSYGYYGRSDAAYSDISYVRLTNLSLSWQLPVIWKKKVDVDFAKLFVLAQNLLTITRYDGLDPETESLSDLPVLRTITVGFQVSL